MRIEVRQSNRKLLNEPFTQCEEVEKGKTQFWTLCSAVFNHFRLRYCQYDIGANTYFWITEKLFWITMQFMNYKVVVLNAWSTFWKLNVFASQLYSPRQYSLTMQTMNRPICIKFLKHKTPRFVLSRNTFTVLLHWYCLSTTPGLNRLVAWDKTSTNDHSN